MTLDDFNRLTAGLRLRLALLIGRGVIQLVDDSGDAQRVQAGFYQGTPRWVERLQNFGFTSHPPRGLSIVAAFLGGDWARGFGLAVGDHKHRPRDLAPGESAMYDALGKLIHMRADGTLVINAPKVEITASERFRVTAPETRVHSTGRTIVECNGRGRELLPDRENDWTIGSVPGAAFPINAPELP